MRYMVYVLLTTTKTLLVRVCALLNTALEYRRIREIGPNKILPTKHDRMYNSGPDACHHIACTYTVFIYLSLYWQVNEHAK